MVQKIPYGENKIQFMETEMTLMDVETKFREVLTM